MTGAELRDILLSPDFTHDLQELSSYLASIKQERPIIYALAKHLWKHGTKFKVEDKRCDLVVDKTRCEFKFYYDFDMGLLKAEMEKYKNLEAMYKDVEAKVLSRTWACMPQLYEDMCLKETDVFVWIICARDLKSVPDDDFARICVSPAQRKYNARCPYSPDEGEYLTVVDSFLELVRRRRPFSPIQTAIKTHGNFPSTYHFRICDFGKWTGDPGA